MYSSDTILALKEPRSNEDTTFAYDRVRVIGPSPVNHGTKADAKYTGPDAQGVIVTPLTEFAGNLDEPFGKLRNLYDVESEPDRTTEVTQTVKIVDSRSREAGPTPEEIFETEAPGKASVDGERVRTEISPLEDPTPDPNASVLGDDGE